MFGLESFKISRFFRQLNKTNLLKLTRDFEISNGK